MLPSRLLSVEDHLCSSSRAGCGRGPLGGGGGAGQLGGAGVRWQPPGLAQHLGEGEDALHPAAICAHPVEDSAVCTQRAEV